MKMEKSRGTLVLLFPSIFCLGIGTTYEASERWVEHCATTFLFCRVHTDIGSCELFTAQVPYFPWRYNKRDQKRNPRLAGAASTEKPSTRVMIIGMMNENPISAEATENEAMLLRQAEENAAHFGEFNPVLFFCLRRFWFKRNLAIQQAY